MFHYGVDYYPEHWPEERWPVDAEMMAAAGLNIVRLAEFAWSKIEPHEGNFDFAWLDRAIEVLTAQDIKIVLGTPTASPPPWVMYKQADLFRVREDGQRTAYGNRREYCPNHPVYHEASRRIVTQMANHYQDHPAVIGWQIDNEFGDRCFCDICRKAFQDWLQHKYGGLQHLNEKWGTVFWSHVYTDWREIPVPSTPGGSPNPGLALDYYRFMSETYVKYQKLQAAILRQHCPDHFITHNLMGFGYRFLNYYDLARDLDLVSWDIYWRMQWNMQAHVDPAGPALSHDTMRSLKKKNFWVMEQQSGAGGWEMVAVAPKPGELRLWAYQSVAHGADGIVYFRWRTCRTGTEQYWHGVLDHHGHPGRRYREIAQMGHELQQVGTAILGSQVRASTAIMQSYDTRFAFQIQGNNPRFSYETHIRNLYQAFYDQHIAVDIISEKDNLTPYKIVIVPAMYILEETTAQALQKFARNGGVVVFTPRTGVKDHANAVVNMELPGLAAEMCGAVVAEYISLPPDQDNEIIFTYSVTGNAVPLPVTTWCDIISLRGAQSAAQYTQDFFAGQTAISINHFEKGHVLYLGTFGDHSLYYRIAKWALETSGLSTRWHTPPGIEITTRWQGDQPIYFVLNHNGEEILLELPTTCTNLLNGSRIQGKITLPARDVLVLQPVQA